LWSVGLLSHRFPGKRRVEDLGVNGQHLHIGVQIDALAGHPLDADGKLATVTPGDNDVDARTEPPVPMGPNVFADLGDNELPVHGSPSFVARPRKGATLSSLQMRRALVGNSSLFLAVGED